MSNSSVGHHAPQICFKFGSSHSRNQHGVQFSRASWECHPTISANARNFPEDLQCYSLLSFTARQCAAARQPVAPMHDASRQVKNSPCPPLEGRLQPRGCGVYKPVTQWFQPPSALSPPQHPGANPVPLRATCSRLRPHPPVLGVASLSRPLLVRRSCVYYFFRPRPGAPVQQGSLRFARNARFGQSLILSPR
eukprot:EG_transcript_21292